MNGDHLALDTNQAIQVLNNSHNIGQEVIKYKIVCLPIPVVGELRYGALNSQRVQSNLERIDLLVAGCKILSIQQKTAEIYAAIRMQLKQDGKPIPENDLWIAALCIEYGIPLATNDTHFNWVKGVVVTELS